MIESAKKFIPNVDLKVAAAEELPFGDNEFDALFFGMVFHEVSDYKKSLIEAFRVAKKYVFINEWEYKEEEIGPPLEHRLKKEFIFDLSKEIGFKNTQLIRLPHLILYILFK